MKEQQHWLFETPLMYEMARHGNGQLENVPMFELIRWEPRESSHQFSSGPDLMAARRGLTETVNFGPARKLMVAIKGTKGKRGIYVVLHRKAQNHQFEPWYIGISTGKGGISERLRHHMRCLRFAKLDLNNFEVQWADLNHLKDEQIRTIEHTLILKANKQFVQKLVNISSTQPFEVVTEPLKIDVSANSNLQLWKPIHARVGQIVKEWEWL